MRSAERFRGISCMAALVAFAFQFWLSTGHSHGIGPRGIQVLNWHTDEISRVVSFTPYDDPGRVVDINGKPCLNGFQFYFDVLDNLAYDIDEPIEIVIEFYLPESTDLVELTYDRNGGAPARIPVELPSETQSSSYTARINLERARFAGRMDFSTDFSLIASSLKNSSDDPRRVRSHTTICGVSISRNFSTPFESEHGWMNLTIRNERGETTPARVSILDESGRMPLPDMSALTVQDFTNRGRTFLLPGGTVNWPSINRYAFYTDGEYRTRLPVGKYTVLVTKGPEYRYTQKEIVVTSGATLDEDLRLERWIDMPSKGWMSGDLHVHIPRTNTSENHALLLQAQAEDLHISNSVQMGNIAATHFPQSFWGRSGRYGSGLYFLIAGQEDPRTAVRGHTLHLNIERPVRNPASYLLYHEVFEDVAKQAGISGYAHLDRLGASVGMALDVPSGHVSFIEVLQRGEYVTDVWFDFLNLGYRIVPAAGSDVPYGARIGDVRNFVKVDEHKNPDRWFAGLAKGRTFVTNGPIVQLRLNEAEMGDEVSLAKGQRFKIFIEASINPDIDVLDRIELVEQGDMVDQVRSSSGSESLQLTYESTAGHSTWFVVRAFGKRQNVGVGSVAALSAPVYLVVDGAPTWKRDQVKNIVERLQQDIDSFTNLSLRDAGHMDEWFETKGPWTDGWSDQIKRIRQRAEHAKTELGNLVRQAGSQ